MTAFVEALFRLFAQMPLWLLHGAGWVLGWLSFLLSSRYRQRHLANARLADVSAAEARKAVGETGKMVAELPRIWLGREVKVGWEGASHIEAAMAHGEGILLLSPHVGCFEITARAFAERFGGQMTMTAMFRPPRQAALRGLARQSRVRPGLEMAPTTLAGVKQLIKALKAGQAVGLLPDQVPPDGQGVWVPYFGKSAYTMTLSARLAHSSGARVLLMWGERLPWGRGYVIRVRPFESAVSEPLSRDIEVAAAQMNRAMESMVLECPSQYLWSYNRYKRPGSHPAPTETEAGSS